MFRTLLKGICPFLPVAGWSSPVARQAHNLKVVGSNPTPATNLRSKSSGWQANLFQRRLRTEALAKVGLIEKFPKIKKSSGIPRVYFGAEVGTTLASR